MDEFREATKMIMSEIDKDINVPNKNDTISRQAALDALGERPMLWVDDDNYTLGARNQYDSNRLAIETVPPVDAVPVVRCRDCEHKDRESGFCHGRGWPMQLVPDDGFCDKGKGR